MKKRIAQMMVVLFVFALVVGCAANKSGGEAKPTASQPDNAAASSTEKPQEIVDVTIFKGPMETAPDENHKYVTYVAEKTGVRPHFIAAPWGGGVEYTQKLQTLLASGEIPDAFRPYNGIENMVISQGAALALDDLLPVYAPNLWKYFPEETWGIVRANSPDGKIYYIPSVQQANDRGIIVRKDWLDKLNLSVPTTQQQFVDMLVAFRDKDPNGNGEKDEIPTSGRELGRWFDHIFAMYGVAMFEGFPDWDIYNGKLEYSAVQPNMKAALAFARDLYKEKLLDNETFLNKADVWLGKITNDKVGAFFHLVDGQITVNNLPSLRKTVPNAEFLAIPLPKVEGYEGFYTLKSMGIEWILSKKAEEKAPAILKYIDFFFTPEGRDFFIYGLEGDTYVSDGGSKKYLADKDTSEQVLWRRNGFLATGITTFNLDEKLVELNAKYAAGNPGNTQAGYENVNQTFRSIAGNGMPDNIYDGFADIKTHKLYQEYMARIIIGDWSIDKFDEFVEKWYSTGGDEVTKRANEWYLKTQKK